MHPSPPFLRVEYRRLERGIFKKSPILDRLIYAHQILRHDTARPDIEMSRFRISILQGTQAHIFTGRFQSCVGNIFFQFIQGGRVRQCDGISRPRRRDAETIEDDKDKGGIRF